MQTFKVGDWIVSKDDTIQQITDIIETDDQYCACTTQYNVLPLNTLKHWQPKPEDYLWDKQFGLSLVITNSHKGKLQCKAVFGYKETFFAKYNKDCEPFIGQLPNLLKENK